MATQTVLGVFHPLPPDITRMKAWRFHQTQDHWSKAGKASMAGILLFQEMEQIT
jgi:hypothetical protein